MDLVHIIGRSATRLALAARVVDSNAVPICRLGNTYILNETTSLSEEAGIAGRKRRCFFDLTIVKRLGWPVRNLTAAPMLNREHAVVKSCKDEALK
jgi:hypothetical protein